MIERIHGLPKGVVGMRAVGTFSVADYVETIEPELESWRPPTASCGCCCSSGPSSTASATAPGAT